MTLAVMTLPALDPDAPLGRRWEALVAAEPGAGFMQSLDWAAFKRAQGLRTGHLGVFDDDDLVGGMVGYAAAAGRGRGPIVVPDGPVVPWADARRAQAMLAALHPAVEDLATDWGALGWRVEPRIGAPTPRGLRNFFRAPVDLLPPETLILDLQPGEDALLAAMRPKGRYNIRLASRRGIAVEHDDSANQVARFYAVMQQASRRADFFLEPRTFFEALFATLAPRGAISSFYATYEGEDVGALLLLRHGGQATYLYGGITGAERPRMGGYALQWAAIRAAKAAGCASYDFYGFEPHGDPTHLYHQFSRFKRQFGGQPCRRLGAHEVMFLDPLADAVVRAAQEIGW